MPLTAKANAEGTLFAAVSAAEVSTALETKAFNVPADVLTFEPIKKVGSHSVKVQWPEVEAVTFNLIVTASK